MSPLQRQKDENGLPRDPRDVALDKFKEIEKNHHPEPLPEDVLEELDRIIAGAEKEATEIFN